VPTNTSTPSTILSNPNRQNTHAPSAGWVCTNVPEECPTTWFAIRFTFHGRSTLWAGHVHGKRAKYPLEAKPDGMWRAITDSDGDFAPYLAAWPPRVEVAAFYSSGVSKENWPPEPPQGPVAQPPTNEARQRAILAAEEKRLFAALIRQARSALRPPRKRTVRPPPEAPAPQVLVSPTAAVAPQALADPSPQPPAPTTSTQTSDLFDLFHEAGPVVAEFDAEEDDDEADEPADVVARLEALAAVPVDPALLSGFQRGHGACPPVALLTGNDLLCALALPLAEASPTAWAGLTKGTRDEHKRLLRLLLTMPAPFRAMQASTAIAEFLATQQRERHWRHVTRFKYMCSCQGALSSLTLYRTGAIPINMGHCPIWRSAMRACAKAAKVELPRQPTPATRQQVTTAIDQEHSLPIRVVLILSWQAAGRVGDVLKLRTDDVTIENNCVQITYRDHKTCSAKGPYSIRTAPLRPGDATSLSRWLAQRKGRKFLFPAPQATAIATRTALRRASATLELRSLRRGALLDMAQRGVAEQTMLEFSGHTTLAMLRRYLSWGRKSPVTAATTEAGARLH
jgi:integrase